MFVWLNPTTIMGTITKVEMVPRAKLTRASFLEMNRSTWKNEMS